MSQDRWQFTRSAALALALVLVLGCGGDDEGDAPAATPSLGGKSGSGGKAGAAGEAGGQGGSGASGGAAGVGGAGQGGAGAGGSAAGGAGGGAGGGGAGSGGGGASGQGGGDGGQGGGAAGDAGSAGEAGASGQAGAGQGGGGAAGNAGGSGAGQGGAGGCAPECGPGRVCKEGVCEEDCRPEEAVPCEAGKVCAELTGKCVTPGEDCTPPGEFVPCGEKGDFLCGPGSSCVDSFCQKDAGCTGMVCDASKVCRGIGCPVAPGGEVKVTGITLAPIPAAAKGQPKAVKAKATVTGENLCGLTATFEIRAATHLFTSAANDQSIFQVNFATGERTTYASGIPLAFGLTVDAAGKLYVLDGQSCILGSLEGPPGAASFVPLSKPIPGCSRIAAGPDFAVYVAAGLEVIRVDLATKEQAVFGSIPDGVAKAGFGSTFLTGITFSPAGEVVVCEHWDGIFRFPVGGGAPSLLANAPGLGLTPQDNPWNEGLAYGIDQELYVGVFPSNPLAGFVYRAGDSQVIADLAGIKAQAPTTNYTGIHGIAWGFDGSMYFTNQNTQGNTYQPFGQVLVRRPDGDIKELSYGLNFDWPKGYDGDLLLGTKVLQTLTAPVSPSGSSEALLDGPASSEPFQVRVLLTDPTTGAVFTASQIGQVQ